MNSDIIEIISILVQKMLQEEDLVLEEEKIVQDLIDLGYNIEDIDQAFELIFSSTEIIDEENEGFYNPEISGSYNRVFTVVEKLYLPVELQGLIRRLITLNVLTPKQSEKLIARTIQVVFSGSTATEDVWAILEEIIEDDSKLEVISRKITEFKDLYNKSFKYIN